MTKVLSAVKKVVREVAGLDALPGKDVTFAELGTAPEQFLQIRNRLCDELGLIGKDTPQNRDEDGDIVSVVVTRRLIPLSRLETVYTVEDLANLAQDYADNL